ncbi:MAG: SpoIIE family protein phosphatase, partial [Proteobacteria bacterium]|nr:SpoIIE family protein phosphatase [Pseudomonadota bacterium]
DGVVEATNSAGEAFGVERLCQVMQASGVAQRIAAVQAALQQHCGPTLAHDDISLMLVGGA